MALNREKVFKFCAFLLFLFCVLMAVTRIVVHGRNGTLSAVAGLLECLVWALFAGLLFVVLFLGNISESFTAFLFGGREYCDETPMSLSHVRGFIAAGNYEEAALLLQELYAQFPDSPDLNFLIFEFYCDCCGKSELAKEFAGNYLKNAAVRSEDNILMLLRYCDLCLQYGADKDDLIDFLLDQSVRNIYSESDKKRIMERVKGLNS
ncbi:MAG: tetratricopeptide repeat protein [Lentisphaeria bacterium]|nr:tetratricopeptide repeat protein [Lentisphaeria bacterium]